MKKKQEERKEKEKEKERMTKSEIQDEGTKDKPPVRLSKSFIERMSAPKHSPEEKPAVKEATPVKVCLCCTRLSRFSNSSICKQDWII